jgi:DNA ligase D-like protein (predicted 3'-phosphoesterase)
MKHRIMTLAFCLVIIADWQSIHTKEGKAVAKKLETYKKKRNFKETPEPKPRVKKTRASKGKNKTIFVIQQHHASHMHFDFRLEMDGILKSWAVPKGPSTDPKIKRLAALTEDHPLDYATFEGIIPSGYGAGTVIVWDTGTYENISEKNGTPLSMADAFEHGHIKIVLHGKKLQGEYVLIRFKEKEHDWLLFKHNDEYADARRNPVKTEPQSVLSGTTIKQLDKQFAQQKKEQDE